MESVLRYGLPANYQGLVLKVSMSQIMVLLDHSCPAQPEPKSTKRVLATLQTQFAYLGRRSNTALAKNKPGQGSSTEEVAGEYQTLLEQEFFDFVLGEVPWIQL